VRIALSALVLLAGCDQVFGLPDRPATDGGVGVDACTLDEFDFTRVRPIIGFPTNTFDPAMSGDGLEMYYVVQSLSLDIYYATRPTVEADWGPGVEVPNANSPLLDHNDADPTITADGTALLFTTTREPGSPEKVVYEMLRVPGEPWGSPAKVVGINVNADSIDITADGKALYVIDGDEASSTLYRFERDGVGMRFEARVEVGVGTLFPSISADESELYFHDDDGLDDDDGIYRETRVGGVFVNAERVIADELDADLSHDGTILTFTVSDGLAYVQRACAAD
jgi:hypothetical protein